MNVTPRLTWALAATGALGIIGYAALTVSSEADDLRSAVERETRLLGRSLQVAIENALRDAQLGDIQETLTRLDAIEPDVDVTIYGVDGTRIAESRGSIASPALEGHAAAQAIADGDAHSLFLLEGPQRLVVAMPLRDDAGKTLGALSVGKPLDRLIADLDQTRTAALLLVLFSSLSVLIVGHIVGRFVVGRPLKGLLAGIRHGRTGRISPELPVTRGDEFGLLAREFRSLVSELAEERLAREAADDERRRMERDLQHADKLIAVGQLSARLAHEIGSPLQVLVGRAQAVVADPRDAARVAHHAGIIVSQGDRIVAIVRDLLTWSKPQPPELQTTDVVAEVRAILDLMGLDARERGIRLALASDGMIPRVTSRAGQLQQVVFNLVRNAFAAMDRGGSLQITIALEPGGRRVIIDVTDTGRGIAPDALARLFEPFFSTRLDDGGHGLGLTVVRNILDAHGGAITASSELGRGSRFTVHWPVAPPQDDGDDGFEGGGAAARKGGPDGA